MKFALFDSRLAAALNNCCGETVVCLVVSATWRSTRAAFQQLWLHMSPENFLAFIGTTAIVTVTPGLDTVVGLHVTQR